MGRRSHCSRGSACIKDVFSYNGYVGTVCGIWSLQMPQSTAETANVLGFAVVKGSEAKRTRTSECNPQTPFTGFGGSLGCMVHSQTQRERRGGG